MRKPAKNTSLLGNKHAFGPNLSLCRTVQKNGKNRHAANTGPSRQCCGLLQEALSQRCRPSLLERSNTLLELGRYREAIADLNEYEHLMSNELTAYFIIDANRRNAVPHVPTSSR